MPIKNGAPVKWTAPGGGVREYAGEVVCRVPAGAALKDAARPHMQGLAYAAMVTQFGQAAQGLGVRARYLIGCPKGDGVFYRTALADIVDKQNPGAPREGALLVCAHQAIGRRDEQEDRYLLLPERGLFAVADGMGGHDGGAEAAQAAVDALAAAAVGASSPEVMAAAFERASEAVAAVGGRCPATGKVGQHKMSCGCHRLPGTTLTALWLDGPRAVIGHIGDTRCWRVRGGKAEQVTKDHSMGHVLLRALGGRTKDEPDVFEVEARPGDIFVLVSDGVLLDGGEIAEVADGPFEEAAERLVAAGAARYEERTPRTDNGTAVCVRVQ